MRKGGWTVFDIDAGMDSYSRNCSCIVNNQNSSHKALVELFFMTLRHVDIIDQYILMATIRSLRNHMRALVCQERPSLYQVHLYLKGVAKMFSVA